MLKPVDDVGSVVQLSVYDECIDAVLLQAYLQILQRAAVDGKHHQLLGAVAEHLVDNREQLLHFGIRVHLVGIYSSVEVALFVEVAPHAAGYLALALHKTERTGA